jgi:hypothetical protein
MTASLVYQAQIRRTRATKAEVEARREALLDIIEESLPPLRFGPVPRNLSFPYTRAASIPPEIRKPVGTPGLV